MTLPCPADLLFTNGTVLTMDEAAPRASAVAVAHGRILAVGGDEELTGLRGPSTRVVDLRGRTLLPGFHDAHDHMLGFGMQLQMVAANASAAPTLDRLVEAIRARAAATPAGSWVKAAGYDDNKLDPARHPNREDLDRATTDHPVYLRHTSGHMAVVNTKALEVLAIDAATADPEGGRIVRDASGRPTGLLLETAMELATRAHKPFAMDELVGALDAADDVYVREGVTSHTEAGIGYQSDLEARAYRLAVDAGRLRVRSTLMVRSEALHRLAGAEDDDGLGMTLGIASGWGDERLRIGAMKLFSDGSLIGQTAAMRDGYVDDPHNHGIFATPKEILRNRILRAHRSGWQIAVHAIGDLAVEFILDCYEEALAADPRDDHRHRIEHCGLVSDATLDRIVRLGVIPVPQQRFIGELGGGFLRVLGRDRVERGLYRQRSFVERGVRVPGSSDRNVVRGAPLLGIHDAVNQRTDDGVAFVSHEALTVEQALRAFTLDAAYASFEEHLKGSITPGKLADFVVLNENPLAVDPARLREVDVVATVIGGAFAFDTLD